MTSPIIEATLLIAAGINGILMMLMLTAYRKRIVHLWFAVLTGAVAACQSLLRSRVHNRLVFWGRILVIYGR